MSQTIYLLNGPIIGAITGEEDAVPLTVQMPSGWNTPRTRYRIRFVGDFALVEPGDLFFRRLMLGKTNLTFSSVQAIMPNETRAFVDEHNFILYGDNLHAIYSIHHTGLNPAVYIGEGARSVQNRNAVNSFSEIGWSDAPEILESDWSSFGVSFFGSSESNIRYSVREFAIEKYEI